jgi:hypothetical protein
MTRTAATLVCLSLLVGCGPRLVTQDVFQSEDGDVSVQLRHLADGGEPVPQGHDQPVMISDVRVAHILAQITHKDAKDAVHPTIRSVHVYPLAEGISKALTVATPADELLVLAYSRQRRFGIFTYDLATAFRVVVREPLLEVEFFAIEEKVEKDPRSRSTRAYEIPAEMPEKTPAWKLEPTKIQVALGDRGLGFDWRDSFYSRPVSLTLRGGRLKRRTILMEAEPEELAPATEEGRASPVLRNAQLEALDRLDADRRNGLLTEPEFQRRRRLILDGRLEEAGYGDVESADE